MPSNKLARTNDDIQFVISKLLREVKDPRVQQGMISVTRVETTGDLRYSKIWLSVLGMRDEKEFRRGLRDHSIEYGAHINEVINSLDIPHDGDEEHEDQ